MQSRSKLIAALVSLVAFAVLAATLGTYRIAVLSTDFGELLDRDVPVERAAQDLRRLASRRAEALGAPGAASGDELDPRIRDLSEEIAKQLEMLDGLFAKDRDVGTGPDDVRGALDRVRSEEAAFRTARSNADTSVAQARGRAVESAATNLAYLSRETTDRAAAQTTADERTSLSLLAGLAIASLGLGALLTRIALRVFSEVQTLRILVPVCSGCHSVRNDPSFWRLVDRYLEDRQHTKLAHGRCPRCEEGRVGRRETV